MNELHPKIAAAMSKATDDWRLAVIAESKTRTVADLVEKFPDTLASAFLEGKRELKLDAQGLKHGEAIAYAVEAAYGMKPSFLDDTYIKFPIPTPPKAGELDSAPQANPILATATFSTGNLPQSFALPFDLVVDGTGVAYQNDWAGHGGVVSYPTNINKS